MEILFIMNTLNKVKTKFIYLLIFVLVSCSNENKKSYEGYAFVQIYDIDGGQSNINLYLMEDYQNSKTFVQNIKEVQRLKAFIFTVDSNSKMAEYIEKLKKKKYEIEENNRLVYFLVYINLEVKDEEFVEKHSDNFDSILSIANEKKEVKYEHFYLINDDIRFKEFTLLKILKNF